MACWGKDNITVKLVTALILSKLDYCNVLLAGQQHHCSMSLMLL